MEMFDKENIETDKWSKIRNVDFTCGNITNFVTSLYF